MDLIDLFYEEERKEEPQWTCEMFEKLVEKYVPKNKLTEIYGGVFSHYKSSKKIMDWKSGWELLEALFGWLTGAEQIYTDSDELMNDLEALQNFSNNSKFLGLESSMNYLAVPKRMYSRMKTGDGSDCLLTRCDAYIWLVQNYFARMDKFSELMAKSVGNRLRREIGWWDYAYMETDLILYRFEEQFRKFLEFDDDAFESTGFKIPEAEIAPNTGVKSIDNVFAEIAQFYDKDYDGDLLIELREELERKNKKRPIAENDGIYLNIFMKQYTLRYLLEHFFGARKVKVASLWDIPWMMRRPLPVIRVFTDKNNKFIIKDEMRLALDLIELRKSSKTAQKDFFAPEITDDSIHDIFHIVEWKDFEKILKSLDLSTDDFHLIDYPITCTSLGTMVPIPIGSDACKLAKYAFLEVFEQIFIHMSRPNDLKNLRKVFNFFCAQQIFNCERNYRFFVKVTKIHDIVERVWIDLPNFYGGTRYLISTQETFSTNKEVLTREVQVVADLEFF